MRTRREILVAARELSSWIAESQELEALERCAQALDGLDADDPDAEGRVASYMEARAQAERLLQQVTNTLLVPLTGRLSAAGGCADGRCDGCQK